MDIVVLIIAFIIVVQLSVRISSYYINQEKFSITLMSMIICALSAYFLFDGEIGFAIFLIIVNFIFSLKVDITID